MILEVSPYLTINWSEVTSYDSNQMSHVMTTSAPDNLISLNRYRFRIKARNLFGDSPYSAEVAVSVAPLPSAPEPVTKNQEKSSEDSLSI